MLSLCVCVNNAHYLTAWCCVLKTHYLTVLYNVHRYDKMEDTSEPTTRPDVVKRKQERKLLINTVVKASLPGRLAPELDQVFKRALQEEIDRWVVSTSQVTYRLSLIWNRLLLFCLKNEYPLPPTTDALFTGMALSGLKRTTKGSKTGFTPLIDDFVSNEFVDFPHIERQRGDCQAILIAARRYKTNFLNACVYPFFGRQKAYIQLWCRLNHYEDAHRVTCAINGWMRRSRARDADPFPHHVQDFVEKERKLLGNPSNLTESALRRCGHTVVVTTS
jgi:hypothetical protein